MAPGPGVAGALLGLVTFATLVSFIPPTLALLGGVLLVGSGVGLSYGTLFLPALRVPVRPDRSDRNEVLDWTLAVHELRDSIRVVPLDWVLTVILLVPSVLLISLGLQRDVGVFLLGGLVGALGPASAALGLVKRSRAFGILGVEVETDLAPVSGLRVPPDHRFNDSNPRPREPKRA